MAGKYCANIDDNTLSNGNYWTNSKTAGTFPVGFDKSGVFTITERETERFQKYTDVNGRQADRTFAGGAWINWITKVLISDLEYPFKTVLLNWDFYADGIYSLLGSIAEKHIAVTAGINGRLRGEWLSGKIGDVRSIVIPGGIINITIISDTQVQITGTTEEYRVRDIRTL